MMLRLLTVTPCGNDPCAPASVERYCSRAAAGESVTQAGRLAADTRWRRFWDSGSSAMQRALSTHDRSLHCASLRDASVGMTGEVLCRHDVRARPRRGPVRSATLVATGLVVAARFPGREPQGECWRTRLTPPPGH